MNERYKYEEFTHQDIDLLMAYNKIKRFKITKEKDLKAGLYVNVRETLSLDNILVDTLWLDGKPSMKRGIGMRFSNARSTSSGRGSYHNTYRLFSFGSTDVSHIGRKKRVKRMGGGAYVGTLIEYNICFRDNSAVVEFVKMLKKAPRFQQHCIINELPYTLETYDNYAEEVSFREFTDSYHS